VGVKKVKKNRYFVRFGCLHFIKTVYNSICLVDETEQK
jgi:hypothetical protein